MKEIAIVFVLIFGAAGGSLYWLGKGENRNIGFNNGQCPRGDYVCGVTWK